MNRNGVVKCFNFVDLKNCQIKHKNSNLLLSIIGFDGDLAELENQIVEEINENSELEIWENNEEDGEEIEDQSEEIQ